MNISTRITAIPVEIMDKWQNVVDVMAQVLEVPAALITRASPPQIEVLGSSRVEGNPYNKGDTVDMASHYCESVIVGRKKLRVSYAPDDPDWMSAPEIKYGMNAYLGLPLLWPGGEIFGTICLLDAKRNPFGRQYETVLLQFKDLVETHLALTDSLEQLTARNRGLEKALGEIGTLRTLLPICANCKKVRDDEGYWRQVEDYLGEHSGLKFTHGICPDCALRLYPELYNKD